jgi:microcystin-dependent protein
MSEPFIAEIRIFAGNFNPRGWAFCDGTELPIAQNTALFSLVGTYYGGDGETTFALPNLQGRAPMQPGAGPGLSPRVLGESGGADATTLLAAHLPPHAHPMRAGAGIATQTSPQLGVPAVTEEATYGDRGQRFSLDAAALQPAGGNEPHNNLQPCLALTFIIALEGIYPSRA